MIPRHKAKNCSMKHNSGDIFFVHLPEYACFYAIPYALSKQGLQKKASQGSIHQWAMQKVDYFEKRKYRNVITVVIGEPTSIAAIQNGNPIDVIDGSNGILSKTGCGAIDSSIVFQLLADGASGSQIEDLLSRQSGFKALAGGRFDLNDILVRRDVRAKFAREIFCYQVLKYIGACIANLGGVDLILFIGEGRLEIKNLVFELIHQLEFLGIKKRMKVVDEEISALTAKDSMIKGYFVKYDK